MNNQLADTYSPVCFVCPEPQCGVRLAAPSTSASIPPQLPSASRWSRAFTNAVSAVAMILSVGCATSPHFAVDVQRIAEPQRTIASYALVVRCKGGSPDNIVETKTAASMRTALAKKGLLEAATLSAADMIVVVDVGMGPPRTEIVTMSTPSPHAPDWPANTVVFLDQATADWPIIRDANGYPVKYSETIVRQKYLHLSAREGGQPAGTLAPELVSITITREDQSTDLASLTPSMVDEAVKVFDPSGHQSAPTRVALGSRSADLASAR